MMKKPIFLFTLTLVVVAFALVTVNATQDRPDRIRTMDQYDYIYAKWMESGHAHAEGEAFIHWDEDGEVQTSCAKCHSSEGMQQFLLDGSVHTAVDLNTLAAAGKKNAIRCEACHTSERGGALLDASDVTFPSGANFTISTPGAICMQCHQGRESKSSVDARIATAGAIGPDTVSTRLSFRNIHYFPAGATQMGTLAKTGYEYDGKTYDARFSHIIGYNDCVTCHDSHSTHVKRDHCFTCHQFNEFKEIRYYGSFMDYDGDGNMSEGIYYEIQTLMDKVYAALLAYTKNVVGKPIVYNGDAYPYWFDDENANGVADPEDTGRYSSFTIRTTKATFNYQFAKKEPASFAHGGKYMIQLLYDTMEDLNAGLGAGAISMAGMHRGDEGHFDGSTEAWRHWDGDGEVPTSCAKCHSATGLGEFLETGAIAEAQPIANGMLCTTCHSSPPALRPTGPVTFPSGATVDMGDNSNLCMQCHQGRASKASVDSRVAGTPPFGFTNIHYYAAAATFFGTEVQGGYEYPGKTYVGRRYYPNHAGRFGTCVECHMTTKRLDDRPNDPEDHNVAHPSKENCVLCHGQDISQPYPGGDPNLFRFDKIRPYSTPDYDGDGDKTESSKEEIQGLEASLYAQMQAYGFAIGKPIIYDSHSYPYFFNDSNGNGLSDPGEAIYPNAYGFDAKMLKAAYNFQLSQKDPAGFVHNSRYIAQLLADSIADLGGNVAPYTWR
jgi:hypothetical protein